MEIYSKNHKIRIFAITILTAAILLLTGCSQSEETVYQIPEDKKLIVYTAHKADVYEPIIKEFEERTGIFVELKAGDTLALFDELQQDAPGTFDVMFGGGIENFEECRDYLEPYKVSEIDQIAEQYRTEGDAYTPFSVLPTVFIYNNKLVYPVAAPEPGTNCRPIVGRERLRSQIPRNPAVVIQHSARCFRYRIRMRRRLWRTLPVHWMVTCRPHLLQCWRKSMPVPDW